MRLLNHLQLNKVQQPAPPADEGGDGDGGDNDGDGDGGDNNGDGDKTVIREIRIVFLPFFCFTY